MDRTDETDLWDGVDDGDVGEAWRVLVRAWLVWALVRATAGAFCPLPAGVPRRVGVVVRGGWLRGKIKLTEPRE